MTQHSGLNGTAACVVIGGFLAGGALIGLAGRRLLAGLRRGAVCRPPACELVAGLLIALVGWRAVAGLLPWWWLPVPLLLAAIAVPLAAVDLAHRRLPDALTLPAYPLLGAGLAIAAGFGPGAGLAWRALLGLLVFGGAHALVHRLAPRSLGAGDVKLAGSLGAVLGAVGPGCLPVAAVLAALVTLVLAARPRSAPVPRAAPHGPGLLAATWLIATFPGADLLVPG